VGSPVGVPDDSDALGGFLLYQSFPACGEGVCAVGAEGRVPYRAVVLECVGGVSCGGVPDDRGAVDACGDGARAVGAEDRTPHSVVVLECVEAVDCVWDFRRCWDAFLGRCVLC